MRTTLPPREHISLAEWNDKDRQKEGGGGGSLEYGKRIWELGMVGKHKT